MSPHPYDAEALSALSVHNNKKRTEQIERILETLKILPAWYGRILIPRAVANEIDAGLKAGVNLPDLVALDWIARASDWPNPPGSISSSSPERSIAKASSDCGGDPRSPCMD